MTHFDSEYQNKIKTILSDFKPLDHTHYAYDKSDKDDNNMLFMTIEDLQTHEIVDNFFEPKENID